MTVSYETEDTFLKSEERALEPVIVSASRATDIPAFYSDWLIERIKHNFVKWKNPFNGKYSYVSFEKTRLFVFWTKNPEPFIDKLDYFDQRNFHYYFQYTLNDYVKEGWEPGLPQLGKRIENFIRLSEKIGKNKVIWRFDPIIISNSLSADEILNRIENIGNRLYPYTERLVFSFIDVDAYRKVKHNLGKVEASIQDIDEDTMRYLARGISEMNQKWGLELGTCSEKIDLDEFGIEHNRCVDDRLIIRLFEHDEKLMEYLGYKKSDQFDIFGNGEEYSYEKIKDKGQRKQCGCIVSKDIGQYNTCPHGCVYCYANSSQEMAIRNWERAKGSFNEFIL